jgi:hypothetical protein
MKTWTSITLAVALAVAACSRERQAAPADTTADGGAGMPMMGRGMAMMPRMRAHLDSVAALSPAEMQARMAAHQALMAEMLDAMGAEMRDMNMMTDSAWTALADSVRRDLADLPSLSGPALAARMREHAERMRRLLARHEGMMRMMRM